MYNLPDLNNARWAEINGAVDIGDKGKCLIPCIGFGQSLNAKGSCRLYHFFIPKTIKITYKITLHIIYGLFVIL